LIVLALFQGTPVTEENWTDDHYAAGSSYTIFFNTAGAGFGTHPDSDSVAYRCVTSPRNNTGPTPTGPTYAPTSASAAIHLKSR